MNVNQEACAKGANTVRADILQPVDTSGLTFCCCYPFPSCGSGVRHAEMIALIDACETRLAHISVP